ncbi:MAG: serine protease, partial [Flavobacterium sp.]|nr:serine protease [Flavobacterium sp.]
MKNVTNLFLVSLLSGVTTLGAYKLFFEETFVNKKNIVTTAPQIQTRNIGLTAENIDFTEAAES